MRHPLRKDAVMDFRYVGFDQVDNTRTYKFDGLEKGQSVMHLVVTADLALFLKHHISLQEGPALCAHKLTTDSPGLGPHDHQLTNEDLLEFAITRDAAETRKAESRRGFHRPPFKPTA